MTRTSWSPRFAWDRRPGGKFDGYGRDYFLPDENGQTGEAAYLSITPRREQIARWLCEERTAMLRSTPLDGLTDQLAWRIAARMGGSADDWPARPALLEAMRYNISYLYHGWEDAIVVEEARADAGGQDPDPRAWEMHKAAAKAAEGALDALARARHLPDDVPEEHRCTVSLIAFDTADELRQSVAERHGDPSDAQLARHAIGVGILHDPDNWWRSRYDARTLRWALEDYFAMRPARRARARYLAHRDQAVVYGKDDRTLVLSRKHTPKWLRRATAGCQVVYPDAGSPQLCRFWDYVDWPSLLRDHSDQLCVEDYNWPTTVTLDIVENARAKGQNAAADIELWFDGLSDTHQPVYSINAVGLVIHDELPSVDVDRYSDQLRAAWPTPAGDAGPWGDLWYEQDGYSLHDLQASTIPVSTLLENSAAAPPTSRQFGSHLWVFCS